MAALKMLISSMHLFLFLFFFFFPLIRFFLFFFLEEPNKLNLRVVEDLDLRVLLDASAEESPMPSLFSSLREEEEEEYLSLIRCIIPFLFFILFLSCKNKI